MAVRIRLSRGGSKKRPFYRIVAADQRAPRDGRFIEKLGTYNPLLPKDHAERLVVDSEKVLAWLQKGAQPTERLQKLFANLGLCTAPVIHEQPKKTAPRAKTLERIKEKEEKAKAAAEAAAAAKAEAEAAAAAAKAEAEAAEQAVAESAE
ncbi:MAG: 30S ribosomal protein S16 [Elusimicrobiaceae bacterium]|nr:30S ribosomal protein S16 [Elusimicrobiaceae bacterium]